MSIKEFTKAAGRYESSHAGIYEMCKKDYPDILEDGVKRCLRPNGRLILRDVVIKCCKKAGLKVEKFEIRKGMPLCCEKTYGEGDRK